MPFGQNAGYARTFSEPEAYSKIHLKKTIDMKTMTCKQLGGACDMPFHATTFEEIAEQSKKHGMQMFKAGDKEHLEAMNKTQELMRTPNAMAKWFENKKKEFENLPDNKL